MTKKLIVANWKMNGDIDKVSGDLSAYEANPVTNASNVVIALPLPYLYKTLNTTGSFMTASQDVSQFADYGAYTGEVSAKMLLDFDVKYTMIGHSERRSTIGEADAILAKKLENIIHAGLTPIFCIGELLSTRDSSTYSEFLVRQLGLLTQINVNVNELIIAYEPIWAIGTGKIPTLAEIAEIVNLIHSFVQKTLPHAKLSVLYGGSVTAKNIAEILQIPDIAGVLVGGASLKVDEFTAICACA